MVIEFKKTSSLDEAKIQMFAMYRQREAELVAAFTVAKAEYDAVCAEIAAGHPLGVWVESYLEVAPNYPILFLAGKVGALAIAGNDIGVPMDCAWGPGNLSEFRNDFAIVRVVESGRVVGAIKKWRDAHTALADWRKNLHQLEKWFDA